MINKIKTSLKRNSSKKAQAVLEYGLLLVMISLPLMWGVNKLLISIINLISTASPQIGVGI